MSERTATKRKENPMAIRSKNALGKSLLVKMMNNSFSDITISDITNGAGLSRQTFYTNFERKEEILEYLLDGLFKKFSESLATIKAMPDSIIIEYFIFWDKNRDFLKLIFKQNLGFIFQECNRRFFMEYTDTLNDVFSTEDWQIPYIKASLSGLTYELLTMWVIDEKGLDVDILSSLASNFISGKLFS